MEFTNNKPPAPQDTVWGSPARRYSPAEAQTALPSSPHHLFPTVLTTSLGLNFLGSEKVLLLPFLTQAAPATPGTQRLVHVRTCRAPRGPGVKSRGIHGTLFLSVFSFECSHKILLFRRVKVSFTVMIQFQNIFRE